MKLLYFLLHRELAILPDKKFFYVKRTSILIIMGIAFLVFVDGSRYKTIAGLYLYSNMAYFLLTSLVILAPVASIDLITSERQNHTLELLLLTDFSPIDIVVAKYFSRIFVVCLVYLSTLPLILFCVSMGGISGQQILASTSIILGFIFLGTAIGLLESTLSKSKKMGTTSIIAIIAFLIISSLVAKFVPASSPYAPYCAFSPFDCMRTVLSGRNIVLGYYNFIWQSIFALLIIIWIVKTLPKIYFREACETKIKPQTLRQKQPYGKITGNPIMWCDYYTIHGGEKKGCSQIITCCLISIASIFLLGGQEEIGLILIFTVTAMVAVWTLLLASWRSFIYEKQRKTWNCILMTNLSRQKIVEGKILAAHETCIIYYVLMLMSYCCLFILTVEDGRFFVDFAITTYCLIMYIITLCILAMHSSLANKTIWNAAIATFLQALLYLVFIPVVLVEYGGFLGIVALLCFLPTLAYTYHKNIIENLHWALSWK